MRLIILFVMLVFSLLSCSLKKKSKVEVTERKTETLKEERKTDVQSVSNASTFADSSKALVYNDAVREVVESYKYAPPDTAGVQYIKEYTRTERDKRSNAKQVSNASAKSEIQDSTRAKYEKIKASYSDIQMEMKSKEEVKKPPSLLSSLVVVVLLVGIVFLFFRFFSKRVRS